jgi:eukaryotic-like serine/threonine-protein kinase
MLISELTNVTFLRKGGQKEVYSAIHPKFGAVAYKKILYSDPKSLERTKREIRATEIMNSPHVPTIFGHNCHEPRLTDIWVVEEFVQGSTIRDVLNRGRKFTTVEIVRFLDTMLELAVQAENNFLVHRDIKPDNIMLDAHGKFWLLDYGIARHLDLASLTESAQQFGPFTLGYAATEQFRNLKKDIDIRADLFSIGIVANEMLTGENFYRKDTHDPLSVLRLMEKASATPVAIPGDSQFQLSGFICMIADFRRTRRPRTASEAVSIYQSVKTTLRL